MTCDDFDKLLHPYVDGEFDDAEKLEADTHLASCAECSQKVLFQRQYKRALRAKGDAAPSAPRAPDSLRRNVLAGVHRESRARTTRQVAAVASAAAVVLVAGTVAWTVIPKSRERYVADAAKRHARSLPPEITAAHDDIERWFGGKLDHRVAVPRFANATISGARLSNVEERPAAYIRYEKRDPHDGEKRSIGLFVFDDAHDDMDAQPLPSVEMEKQAGYNVALWRDGEIVYEMVTDLDEQDIKELLAAQERGATGAALPSSVPTPMPPSTVMQKTPSLEITPAALRQ